MRSATPLFDLPGLTAGLPPPPPRELLSALNAAARCFARYGVTRTSMTDIGRELGVSRSTIYRQLGSVERTVRLLVAHEVNDLVQHRLPKELANATGPDVIVRLLAEIVDYARSHPVVRKALHDEPEVIGPYLVTDLPKVTAQVAELVSPLLRAAMDLGLVRHQNAEALAGWLVRVAIVLVLDPLEGSLRPLLDQVVLPVLNP
ncbi:MAG: TetR/AcrR family transcriptional regulator [Acidimicrobiales bacterium]